MHNRRSYLFIVILLAALLAFWRVGQADVNDWDEARNGVNAYEMYHNGNYVNLYYNGAPDTWNAKPPLMTWLIVASYHLFGFNEFALRLPSVLSAIVFFAFFFKLVDVLEGHVKAFMCCLILLSCKAVLGTHVGITGDYDALLLCLLTIAAYNFVLYTNFGRPWAICATGIFTALAFYTKGTAAFLYLPGFVLYLFYKGSLLKVVKDPKAWLSLLLFIGIAATWVVLVATKGQYNTASHYGSGNALETMLVHDTYRRLTSTGFEQVYQPDHLFVPETLDTRLNLWNYLFYISVVTGLILLYKNRYSVLTFIRQPHSWSTVFAICIAAPLFIILTIATNKHSWYLVPALPFVVIITVNGIYYLANRWRPIWGIFYCVFLFAFIRHFAYINGLPQDLHRMFALNNTYTQRCKQVVLLDVQPAQRILLYVEWLNLPISRRPQPSTDGLGKNTLLIIKSGDADRLPVNAIRRLGAFDDCCLAIVK